MGIDAPAASRPSWSVALVLLLAACAGVAWSLRPDPPPVVPGLHAVRVEGASGTLWNGTAVGGSALEVLLSAAYGNFSVEVDHQAAFGPGCEGSYVVAIGGDRETSSGGWNYYVSDGGAPWRWVPVAAACHRMEDGQALLWRWVDG